VACFIYLLFHRPIYLTTENDHGPFFLIAHRDQQTGVALLAPRNKRRDMAVVSINSVLLLSSWPRKSISHEQLGSADFVVFFHHSKLRARHTQPEPRMAPTQLDVRRFGVVGDGRADCTTAVQAAIAAAAGTVWAMDLQLLHGPAPRTPLSNHTRSAPRHPPGSDRRRGKGLLAAAAASAHLRSRSRLWRQSAAASGTLPNPAPATWTSAAAARSMGAAAGGGAAGGISWPDGRTCSSYTTSPPSSERPHPARLSFWKVHPLLTITFSALSARIGVRHKAQLLGRAKLRSG